MAFHPNCHFLAPDFWVQYEKARESGVFYFWGHSYELVTETMWNDFEKVIERISADSMAVWGNVADLFDGGI
jgi:peptidoglycan-N-acetylglucosamine deacetylase